MKKNDIYMVIFLIFLSALLFIFCNMRSERGDYAVIYLNGKEYARLPLAQDTETDINGTNTVCIKNGEVFMQSASCPDKICMHQAPLSSTGRDIVCLPNKVTIRVTSQKSGPADATAR